MLIIILTMIFAGAGENKIKSPSLVGILRKNLSMKRINFVVVYPPESTDFAKTDAILLFQMMRYK